MAGIQFMEHCGIRILRADYSGLSADALRHAVTEASALLLAEPPGSVLVLVNVQGVPYTLENVGILRGAAVRNKPFVKARAVVGLSPLASFSYKALAHASGRPMESFESEAEALAWLVQRSD